MCRVRATTFLLRVQFVIGDSCNSVASYPKSLFEEFPHPLIGLIGDDGFLPKKNPMPRKSEMLDDSGAKSVRRSFANRKMREERSLSCIIERASA